jgi:hypothetical protein
VKFTVHGPGRVLLATNTKPAPTKDTACIEPIGAAERAATAEPEALEAPGQAKRLGMGNMWLWASASTYLRHHHCNPTPDLTDHRRKPALPPRDDPTETESKGRCVHNMVLRDGPTDSL